MVEFSFNSLPGTFSLTSSIHGFSGDQKTDRVQKHLLFILAAKSKRPPYFRGN